MDEKILRILPGICKVRERTGMSYTMASGKGMVLDARKWGHHSLALFSLLCHHWTYETASVGLQATSVPGPSVFPSGEPGVSGDFWGSQEGCQGGLVGSPCSPRDSQESSQHHSSKASILQCSAFFTVQLSHLILCCPLHFLPSIFSSLGSFSMSQLFT